MTKYLNKWCSECQEEIRAEIIERESDFTFKGETFTTTEKVPVCSKCGEELTDDKLDSELMERLTDMYMERMGLSFKDIKNVREQYGLSMELFSKILGWSKATIVRYESGDYIPDASHLFILKKLKENPQELENFYKHNKQKFSEKEQLKTENYFKKFDSSLVEIKLLDLLKVNYTIYEKTIESGYSKFHLEKLINMILFFANEGVPKTKLMKLLFYTDFLHYKRNLVSISGIPYLKYNFGPVPKDYNLILSAIEKNKIIDIEVDDMTEYTFITIKSKKEFEEDLFTTYELEVMEYIKDHFEEYGSVAISTFSHNEDGWKYTSNSDIIPYSYADSLQLD